MGPLFIYLQHTLRAKAVIPAFKIFYLSHQPSLHLRLDLIFLSSVRIFWWVLTFITCVKQHFSELSSLSNYLSYEQRLMFWAKRSSRGNCSVGVWPHSWNRSSLLIWFNIITNKLKRKILETNNQKVSDCRPLLDSLIYNKKKRRNKDWQSIKIEETGKQKSFYAEWQ